MQKWKARLNIDGSQMVKVQDYDHTYTPVSKWSTICLLLVLTKALVGLSYLHIMHYKLFVLSNSYIHLLSISIVDTSDGIASLTSSDCDSDIE